MSYRLYGRILKLEQQFAPPDTRRILVIPMIYGEPEEQSIAQAGIEPGPHDLIVTLVHYEDEQSCS